MESVEVIETLPVKLANRCLVDGQAREKDEIVYIDKAIAECFGTIVKDSPADKPTPAVPTPPAVPNGVSSAADKPTGEKQQ